VRAPGTRRAGGAGRTSQRRRGWLVPLLLAGTLVAGCDHPFDPYDDNTDGPFSIYGYLDLKADTQWIRVMPVRQTLVSEPRPIDAVVTLEHMGTGRVITMRDSLFSFTDPRLDSPAYAYNFWTDEPLEAAATYRLRAVRSDGAETTALVEMPREPAVSLFYELEGKPWPRQAHIRDVSRVVVRGEQLLYADIVYAVWNDTLGRPVDPPVERQRLVNQVGPDTWEFRIRADSITPDTINYRQLTDVRRPEARIVIVPSDWPYPRGLSLVDIFIPGLIPSNVEGGVGFVGGVAHWAIPLARCIALEARPDGSPACTTHLHAASASITGRLSPPTCANPMETAKVRLTQRYPGGGAVVLEYKADWEGLYGFEGLVPGADLALAFYLGARDPDATDPVATLAVPPLEPGQRFVAPEVSLTCPPEGAPSDR
jgi:hypothetical protein